MRKLVTIREISEVLPHPNAERLEIVKVDGWQCVTGKGNFKEGDPCVYFEIDSFVPVDKEPFKFLEKNAIKYNGKFGARIRTMKLRGELSQGLVLPVKDAFGEDTNYPNDKSIVDLYQKCDFSERFGVEKWEPTIPAQLSGTVKGSFPSFIRKTDQERIQNLWGYMKKHGEVKTYTHPETGEVFTSKPKITVDPNDFYEVTIKLDGSSMTAYYKDGEFGVCSRNLELMETEDNSFWKAARKYEIEEKLREFGVNIALQGELIGPGIQGNNEGLSEIEFRVFDVFFIDTQEYADAEYRRSLCATLDIPQVPTLTRFETGYDIGDNEVIAEQFDFQTLEEALAYADGPSLNINSKREGIVYKSINNPNFSFKIISNDYLLSER